MRRITLHEDGEIPMSVHVKFETPEAVATKIYELVAYNSSKIKKVLTKLQSSSKKERTNRNLAEDVNPPRLVHHIL